MYVCVCVEGCGGFVSVSVFLYMDMHKLFDHSVRVLSKHVQLVANTKDVVWTGVWKLFASKLLPMVLWVT